MRLVSFPSWELFAAQEQAYRDAVLPPASSAVWRWKPALSQGWERWVGEQGARMTEPSALRRPIACCTSFWHYG